MLTISPCAAGPSRDLSERVRRENVVRPNAARIARTFLIALGLIALAASWRGASNYISSITSVQSLELELTEVHRTEDGSARLILQFKLHNRSPLPIRLNSYFFNVFLDGERIGGSNSAFLGNDPNVDQALYSRASTIDQTLAPHAQLEVSFPLFIYDLDRIIGARAQASTPLLWTVEAGIRLVHPFGRDERLVRLQADLQE